MLEEFHGINHGSESYTFQLLYGWNTLNTNVWLPSLSELVGIDTNNYHDERGVYLSAMQGVNTSTYYRVDAQGGTQFAYFKQYNAAGGGEKIWDACKQELSWLRSSSLWATTTTWRIAATTSFNTISATASLAVHPVRDTGFKVSFWLYPPI